MLKEILRHNLVKCGVFFLLLSTLWVSPFWLSGKTTIPSDTLLGYFPWRYQAVGAKPGYIGNHRTTAIDIILQTFPKDTLLNSELKRGRMPLWDPYTLCGTPNVGVTYTFYPPRLLAHYLFSPITAHQLIFQLHIFLVGFFASAFLLRRDLSIFPALFGGTAATLGGHALAWAEFESPTGTLAWALFCLWQTERLSKRASGNAWQTLEPLGWQCLGFSLLLLPGHPQYSLYAALMVVSYSVYRLRNSLRLLSPLVYGIVGTAGASLFLGPLLELTLRAGRPSVPALEMLGSNRLTFSTLLTLTNPEFLGTSAEYFFLHTPRGNICTPEEFWVYSGLLVFILSPFGMRRAPFFVGVAVISLLYAAGPLHMVLPAFFTKLVPGRVVMFLSLSLSIMAAHGLERWTKDEIPPRKSIFMCAVSLIPISVTLLSANAGLNWFSTWSKEASYPNPPNYVGVQWWARHVEVLVQNHFSLFNVSWWMTLVLALVAAVLFHKKFRAPWFLLLLFIDLFFFSQKLHVWSEPESVFPAQPGLSYLQNHVEQSRVAPSVTGPRPNLLLPYRLQDVGGYHALYSKRHALFWEEASGIPSAHAVAVKRWNPNMEKVINLTSATYVYTDPLRRIFADNFFGPPVYDRDITIYKNERALPRAYIVQSWESKATTQDALTRLFEEGFDPRNSAIVEGSVPEPSLEKESLRPEFVAAEYQLLNPGHSRVNVETTEPVSLLVVTDSYYPGWVCKVDGEPRDIVPCNGIFRGVFLGPGRHQVEFSYQPAWWSYCLFLTFLAVFIEMALISIGLYRQRLSPSSSQTG